MFPDQGAGWIMVVLSLGAVGLRYQLVEQSYQATGRPQYITLANLIRMVALVLGIFIGQRFWGVQGAIIGIALIATKRISPPPAAWLHPVKPARERQSAQIRSPITPRPISSKSPT